MERSALGAVFLANGLAAGGFFARLPEQQERLGLSDAALGATVVGLAAGALVTSPYAGRAVNAAGSRRVVVFSACALGATWWLAGAAPNAGVLFAALLVIGGADAAMDISMNANASAYEARIGRSVLHRLHALWSAGVFAGAALASAAAAVDVVLTVNFLAIGGVVVATVVAAQRHLPGDGPAPQPAAAPGAARGGVRRVVVLLAMATAGGAAIEGAATDWSAIQLERLGTSHATAGWGVAAFMAGMVAGRLVGDRLTDRFGSRTVLRGGMLLVAAAMGAGLAVAEPAVFAAGVAITGAGTSVFFPLAFSASTRIPGLSPGAGAATVSLGGRVGFIAEPIVVGLVADLSSLRVALSLVVVIAAVLAATAARLTSPGDHGGDRGSVHRSGCA